MFADGPDFNQGCAAETGFEYGITLIKVSEVSTVLLSCQSFLRIMCLLNSLRQGRFCLVMLNRLRNEFDRMNMKDRIGESSCLSCRSCLKVLFRF